MSLKGKVILQIIPALRSGGVERGTIDVAREIVKQGATAIIASNGGEMSDNLQKENIIHITLPMHSKNPITIWRNISRVNKIIKKYQVNLVHVRSRAPAWSAYKACLKRKIPLVSTIHGPYSIGQGLSGFLKKSYNMAMFKADKIVAVSGFIKDYIQKNYNIEEGKISVINRGVDVDYFNSSNVSEERVKEIKRKWGIKNDLPIIGLPARYTDWKGHNFFLDALKKTVRQNFICIFFGSDHGHGYYKQKLIQRVEQDGLEDRVKVMPVVDDMPAALKVCDIVVSASTRPEAFGRVSIEAQAMGRIVIATNIGGSLYTIKDEESGFLCEAGKANNLAIKLENALMLGKDLSAKMSKNARQNAVNCFSNKTMLNSILQLYEKLLEPSS